MSLVNRGRLSVQSVTPAAWTAITLLAERGGWQNTLLGTLGDKKHPSVVKQKLTAQPTKASTNEKGKRTTLSSKGRKRKADDDSGSDNGDGEKPSTSAITVQGSRRSTRRKA
jgi:hypothetical protein